MKVISDALRSAWQGIKNLVYWFPVVWHDRDWDYSFLLEVMRHKVAQMHRAFVWYDEHTWRNHSDSHRIRQLLVARVLLERQRTGGMWYLDNAHAPVYKRWGEPSMDLRETDDGNMAYVGLIFPNARTPEEQRQANSEYSKWNSHSMIREQEDLAFLFDWMKKYIMRWWD